MPSKLRDNSLERRRERKERSRSDKEKSEGRERRHRSSTHRTLSTKEKTTSRTSLSSVDESKRRSSMPDTLDEDETPSNEIKLNRPYPTFSKAHSKEAVGSHPSLNLFTPPPTDIDASKDKTSPARITNNQSGYPSPPLTDRNSSRSQRSVHTRPSPVETIPEEHKRPGKTTTRQKETSTPLQRTESASASSSRQRSTSEAAPIGPVTKPKERTSTPVKRVETPTKVPQRSVSQPMQYTSQQTRSVSPTPSTSATEVTANASSVATSIAPEQLKIQRPGSRLPAAVIIEDSLSQVRATPQSFSRQQTPFDVILEGPSPTDTPFSAAGGPPPPPPPPIVPISIPRVDYLLQNGGLNTAVPRNILYAGKPMAIQQAQTDPGQAPIVVAHLFEPFNTLLGDYEKVMAKNGSLAVATGYKSVARRLLDRLENVFARDISCEACGCSMCAREPQLEDSRGVSWGEILELVSGRRELPDWPPFALVASPRKTNMLSEIEAPMQKVDIDVPEEYREHYIRQSRKTKQTVDRWLNLQGTNPSSPPEEADDETLTFTILTHLPVEQRQTFKNLLGIVDRPLGPPRRAPSPDSNGLPQPSPTPHPRERVPHIITTGTAIQRLYRLTHPPRDPEAAIFLLNNPSLHNALATLAAVSNDEWDILTSGRFDGFLRSGAEDVPEQNSPHPISRGPSRNGTPAYMNGGRNMGGYPSRQPTPAVASPQHGAPIALDEETEILALAEIERDIYSGMEALEDAFEALHQRAEVVRRALRERSAGLAAAAQRRRGNSLSEFEIRSVTPGMNFDRWEMETDDGLGDWEGISEIVPDDSASNISSSRRRRPKRRDERRTPAIIEEDDEDYAESEGTQSPRKS